MVGIYACSCGRLLSIPFVSTLSPGRAMRCSGCGREIRVSVNNRGRTRREERPAHLAGRESDERASRREDTEIASHHRDGASHRVAD